MHPGGRERKNNGLVEIRHLMRAARTNLDLDVAFIGQFVGNERVIRLVDVANDDRLTAFDTRMESRNTLCKYVVEGALPGIIKDTSSYPLAHSLPAVRDLPVGAQISVPIRLSDGTIYGTFCCFAHLARPDLHDHDLTILRAFADVTAHYIENGLFADEVEAEKEQRITALLQSAGPDIVYQPVFLLDGMRIAGAEALSRFPDMGSRTVDRWFKDAADVGLQTEMELLAIRNALAGYRPIWEKHQVQLGLNASATTIADERLWHALEGYPRDLIVIELTEHEQVNDYTGLLAAAAGLRAQGTKLAIDDVGAGYASMRHVLTVRPDILKLDVGLTRSINSDDLKAALASSLKHFADRFDCRVVAEGVETREELAMLQELGMQGAQGYLLSRPVPVAALLALLDQPNACWASFLQTEQA